MRYEGTARLNIMFPFFGAKKQYARNYPSPRYPAIVEPFAGAAGYSLTYPSLKVTLCDLDPVIAGVWDFLIHARESEVLSLPLLSAGEEVSGIAATQEAKDLIGFWVNPGSAVPKNKMSSFSLQEGSQFRRTRTWGEAIRHRIASQQKHIRHWDVSCGEFSVTGNSDATWFIDPPYEGAGNNYRLGSSGIDYSALATWVTSRNGQIICCEEQSASWLPFRPLFEGHSNTGSLISRKFKEGVWTRP